MDAGGFIEASPVAGLTHTPGPVATTLTGSVINRYTVGRLIGAGGMGAVYAAHDTTSIARRAQWRRQRSGIQFALGAKCSARRRAQSPAYLHDYH